MATSENSTDPLDEADPAWVELAPDYERARGREDSLDRLIEWLSEASRAGVQEPHAATLATVDAEGLPDARTLILKDVGERGWAFAGPRSSQTSAQLAAHPAAALNFWWQPIVRAVRVRGIVREASRADSDADIAARPAPARAEVVSGGWVLWRIEPTRGEFWQGAADRQHARVVYFRDGSAWSRVDPVTRSSDTGGLT